MTNIDHNKAAWDQLSGPGCPWSVPVTADEIERARRGEFVISVAGGKPLPSGWLGEVRGQKILCLAGAGGQQAPLLAAAGGKVCVMDLSDAQLELDRTLARDHGLDLRIEQGSMTDLARFGDGSFDLIVNPVSSCYVPDIQPVWHECARVLRTGGRLVSGSINPLNYLFEENDGSDARGLEVKYALPFVEHDQLNQDETDAAIARNMVFTWSHSLEELVQGQVDAGFTIHGLLEARRTDERAPAINQYAPTYLITLAVKSSSP